MTTRRHAALRRRTLAAALALPLLGPLGAGAQDFRFEGPGEPAREIGRDGAAVIIEAAGPPLFGQREFYRPVPPLELRNRWLLVQDSTFGVVFSQASGVKPDLESYEGDLYLRALVGVSAVEVRALIFNVWGEPSGHLTVTVLMERGAGESWEIHPRWRDVEGPPHEHRTSIVWINRVMFDDESILEADLAPVGKAWEYVTGSDFEGLEEEPLLRAIGQ